MKFLVECRIQILLQEITGYLKTGQCHLGRLPVSGSGHISLPGLHSTHHNPDNNCCGNQKYHTNPISERLDEEMSLEFVRRYPCPYETYILSQIPDAFPVRHDNSGRNGLICSRALLHIESNRFSADSHILAGIDIII